MAFLVQRGSSPVDWCEQNYVSSANIAEFVNTLTNVLFIVVPPVLIHLFKGYSKLFNPAIHVIWISLMIIGLSSIYFHSTLSLLGQMLDELSILWLWFTAFAMFLPRRFFPSFVRNRKHLGIISAMMALGGTALGVMNPEINSFILMLLVIPSMFFFVNEIRRDGNPRVVRLGIINGIILLTALVCWFNDRFLCEFWTTIKFPYLHGLWHIFIFLSCYLTAVLFAYFTVKTERPEMIPTLHYWPKDSVQLGIVYVLLKSFCGRTKKT